MASSSRRPIRIANCSGALTDPGDYMLSQAKDGDVDVITGDYLAEANLGTYAEPYAEGKHPGYVPTALEGLTKTLPLVAEERFKIIVNGGALNPKGLAEVVGAMAKEKNYDVKVAYVLGDDLPRVLPKLLAENGGTLPHLDVASSPAAKLAGGSDPFRKREGEGANTVVSASAYLGSRGIRKALDEGADIVICGRVADASPVIAAAAWWHSWPTAADEGGESRRSYDRLAGALVAGHLVECSFYATGGNFAGFDRYSLEELLDLRPPIVEVDGDGGCVVTKHDGAPGVAMGQHPATTGGFVTEDTVTAQLLYELQGRVYLHSDVAADLADVRIQQVGKDKVAVSGITGSPPPPTTKLAVFYTSGYQGELTVNATGYATQRKYDLQEAQIRRKLDAWGVTPLLSALEFQRVGVPMTDPTSQLSSTTGLRIFVQAPRQELVKTVLGAFMATFMQHFPGMCLSLDLRLMSEPARVLGYYPAVVPQAAIDERAVFLPGPEDAVEREYPVPPPRLTRPVGQRESYNPSLGELEGLAAFKPTRRARLGDVALARSGDKGANINVGFFIPSSGFGDVDGRYAWLRLFLTTARLKSLMREDWRDEYHVERVEFAGIRAVHFVVYGILGRGVSSSSRLDNLGKGFGEFLRDVWVDVPLRFLGAGEKVGGRQANI